MSFEDDIRELVRTGGEGLPSVHMRLRYARGWGLGDWCEMG